MRYEYIQPFVTSTKNVLQAVLSGPVTSGGTELVEGGGITADVMIIVHLAGDTEGSVILSLNAATALRVCEAMSKAVCRELSSGALDIMAELANMITGNAASILNDLGHDFTVFPPIVLAAANMREKVSGVEMVRIPVRSGPGEITVNIAMKTA